MRGIAVVVFGFEFVGLARAPLWIRLYTDGAAVNMAKPVDSCEHILVTQHPPGSDSLPH